MRVGKEIRGSLWVDGQFTIRVRGPGPEPARSFRVRRPFALIGRIPGADLRIDDPAVDGRHTFLILDQRGLLGVDLLSQTGTRFAAETTAWSWLGPGDLLEIAGRRIEIVQLRVDGSTIEPSLSSDDPFVEVHASKLASLTLEPIGSPGSPWMLGSALAFVGRGEACVIKIDDDSVSTTHCALLRTSTNAYIIDLMGRQTLVNDHPVAGACLLLDGDILTIGRIQFRISVEDRSNRYANVLTSTSIEKFTPSDSSSRSTELALNPREALVAMLLDAADPARDASNHRILEVLHQFQSDTATLLESQIQRIEALNREITLLRHEVQGSRGPVSPPATPLRLDLAPPVLATTDESATWLLNRLNTIETESRSTWKDLLGRLTSTVGSRTEPATGQTLASNRVGPGQGNRS